jgi:signal transduction histidine kinase
MADRAALHRFATSRRSDPALAAFLTAACIAELLARPEMEHSLAACAVLMALGVPVAFRRSHPLQAICAEAAVFVVVPDFASRFPPDTYYALAAVLAYSCAAHGPRRAGLLAVVAFLVALQIAMGFDEAPNVELCFVTLAPWWAGRQVRLRRQTVSELDLRTRELEAEEEVFVGLSVRRERARIARELHDIVSHHLAVMVIQAGAGRMADGPQGVHAPERLATIRDSGLQALAEMGRLVDMLQADSSDRVTRLSQLLERARTAGPQIQVEQLPAGVELSLEVQEGAYRVVQEGLTNAMKHASGAEVFVRLALDESDLLVEVRNGPAVTDSELATTGSGLGLSGMRDRIHALGGSLDAGPEPDGGWRLCARFPVADPAALPRA